MPMWAVNLARSGIEVGVGNDKRRTDFHNKNMF